MHRRTKCEVIFAWALRQVEANIQLGRSKEARAFLEALRAVNPNHPDINELDARIGK